MRRCPECYEIYDEGERFCEVDGRPLLNDPALSADDEETSPDTAANHGGQQSWLTGLVGVTVGILLCAAVYAAHAVWTAEPAGDRETAAYSAKTQEPVQSVRPVPARMPEPASSPTEDEPLDSEAEASPEAPTDPPVAPETQTVAARLNQGPVSTGQKVKDHERNDARIQTIILMKDGSSVEVDAAWEDKQGVWYRRGGLVSFVESQLVKAITARAEPKSPNDTAP